MKQTIAAGILLVVLAFASATSVNAQGPYCGGGFGYGCANFPYGLYGNRINEVPYFSMFPPVYYSMPVPRTYGWSPFAYPPGTMTPEVEVAEGQDMVNPYVPQNKEGQEARPTSVKVASLETGNSKAQVVINPFVNAASTAIAAK
jgi:hypothetical protein